MHSFQDRTELKVATKANSTSTPVYNTKDKTDVSFGGGARKQKAKKGIEGIRRPKIGYIRNTQLATRPKKLVHRNRKQPGHQGKTEKVAGKEKVKIRREIDNPLQP